MKFIFKYNDLIQRNRTELLSETGDLCFWGIYDFAFKYRTRIFDKEDVEIAYVEKDVTASKDTVRFYDAAGKQEGALVREDGKLILENEDLVYQGDARSGKIEGLMSVSEGILEVKEEKDVLKAAEVLFSLIEIDR